MSEACSVSIDELREKVPETQYVVPMAILL